MRNEISEDFKNASKSDWAYLAALVDVRGTFTLIKEIREKDNYTTYRTYLSIYTPNRLILEWLNERFEGIGSIKKASEAKIFRKRREFRSLRVSTKLMINICNGILPHLNAKKEQCKIMLEMRSLIHKKKGNKPIDLDNILRREELIDMMKNAHKSTKNERE